MRNPPFTVRFKPEEVRDLQKLSTISGVPMTAIMRIALNKIGAIALRYEDAPFYTKVDFKLHQPGLNETMETFREEEKISLL